MGDRLSCKSHDIYFSVFQIVQIGHLLLMVSLLSWVQWH